MTLLLVAGLVCAPAMADQISLKEEKIQTLLKEPEKRVIEEAKALPKTLKDDSDQEAVGFAPKWFNKITEGYFSHSFVLETAYATSDLDVSKFDLAYKPEYAVDLNDSYKLTAKGIIRGKATNKLEPLPSNQDEVSKVSSRYFVGDVFEFELREFYVSGYAGPAFIKVGKQQTVWGQADGLKVIDRVNPQNLHEFILPEFSDSRIPLWSANIEIPIKDFNVEFVWVPDMSFHDFPDSTAEFAFTSPMFVPSPQPGIASVIESYDRPNRLISDSDVGLNVSSHMNGWDLSFIYLFHFIDTPVLYQSFGMDSGKPIVTVSPKYERSHLVGATASNAFSNFTIRAELGYSSAYYSLANLNNDADGIAKTDELSTVLGIDYHGWTDWFVSMQFFQSLLGENPDDIYRDHTENTVTLFIQKKIMHETLSIESLFMHNLNRQDGLIRPKINYEWSDEISFWFGIDVFYGDENGLFGQFDSNDRYLFGIKFN